MNMAEGLAASYVLDAAKSRFLVKASATGLLSAFGHNPTIAIRGFTGEAWFRAASAGAVVPAVRDRRRLRSP